MPVKTTLIALSAVGAFSAAIVIGTSTCATAAGRAANPGTANTKVFERSIHGSYRQQAYGLPARPSAAQSKNSARKRSLVFATGSATTAGGYLVRRVAARYRALAKWRIIAGEKYGPGATRWTLATNKTVTCARRHGEVSCTVSGHPENLLQRLGLAQE